MNISLVDFPGPRIKTPSVQTLGVLLFGLLFGVSVTSFADCMPAGKGETAVVERVQDGDTVKLKDGRQVRVLGINTPEIEHDEKVGQALGRESRRAAEAFFGKDKRVRLFYDIQRVDRYGRTLAHLYDVNETSLSAHLLRKGLGFHVAVPPNLSLNECLHKQESIARNKSLGVWGDARWKPIPASRLKREDTGYKRVTGRVMDVRKAQSIWLELDGPIVIKIAPKDIKNFPVRDWSSWKGRRVEVRGWVTEHKGNEKLGKKNSSQKTSKKSYKELVIQPRVAGSLDLLGAQ